MILLPVTNFSFKTLVFEHQSTFAQVSAQTNPYLYALLLSNPTSKSDLLFPKTFGIRGDKRIVAHIKKYGARKVAAHLHKIQLLKMYEDVQKYVYIGKTAKESLQLIYEMRGLVDEDYDIDTAYRNWDRYKQRKIGKKTQNSDALNPITQPSENELFIKVLHNSAKNSLSHVKKSELKAALYQSLQFSILDVNSKTSQAYNKRIIVVYVLYYLRGLSMRQVEHMTGIKQSSISRIHKVAKQRIQENLYLQNSLFSIYKLSYHTARK